MADLQTLILEDHNRLRELLRSAVSSPDDHAVQSLVRALVIHEGVEDEMLEWASRRVAVDLARHALQTALHHRDLYDLVVAMRDEPTAAAVRAVERECLVHLEQEERVLLPAIAETAGPAGMERLGNEFARLRAEVHRGDAPFRLLARLVRTADPLTAA
ncbi:MAG: hypothetical protein JWM05_3008 [Acidimicrobiales bacterium]|nr:hypothetical protein [Acidimicrobiales bacterium]